MSARRDLVAFARDALAAGRTPDAIRDALTGAGWSARDADWALGHFADTGFTPPVPRPRATVSARDAYVFGLMFFALVVVVINVTGVMFDVIDAWTAEASLTRDRLAWDAALLMVFVPLFAWLDRRTRSMPRDAPARQVFGYVALFLASLTVLLTFVAVLALVISGGLAAEIALKALAAALVAAGVFLYYRRDLTGA